MENQNEKQYGMSPGGIFQCRYDAGFTLIRANDSLFHFLGYTRAEFKKLFCDQMVGVIHPEDLEPMRKTISEQLERDNVVVNEHRLICRGGRIKWIWISCELKTDENQEFYFYCMFHDITKQKQAQEQLELSEQRYEIILSQTQDIVFEWNCETGEIYYSPNFEKKFGYSAPRDGFPRSILEQRLVYPADWEGFRSYMKAVLNGKGRAIGEYRIVKADKSYIWCRTMSTTISDSDGRIRKVIGMISDIDEQKRRILSVQEQAMRDQLTGLYNRGATELLISAYLEEHRGLCAMLVIDVDNFKGVNDRLGHIYGDAVLGDMAYNLKLLSSKTDVAGRVGGDEFVFFLADIHGEQEAVEKAEAIGEVFHRWFGSPSLEYEITGSIGISLFPRDGRNYLELFEKADLAMYYAKNNGKNQYCVYNEEILSGSHCQLRGERKEDVIDESRRNFRDNIIEYIFQIFYENPEVDTAIPVLLDLVGKTFRESRVYIMEASADRRYLEHTFEWCNSGVPSFKEERYPLIEDIEELGAVLFDSQNIYGCSDVEKLPDGREKQWLKRRGVVSTLICKVEESGRAAALIGFEECLIPRKATGKEREVLTLIAQTISLFLMRTRKQEESVREQRFSRQLLEGSRSCIYGIDPETYEIIFVNDSVKCRAEGARKKEICYRAIRGFDNPCPDCPIRDLTESVKSSVAELYHPRTGRWTETSASYIQWKDGRNMCLLCSFDITKYRADTARIDFLLHCIPGGLMGSYLDEDYPLRFINKKMLNRLGYRDEKEFRAINGDSTLDCIHPEDLSLVKKTIETDLLEKGECECDYRIRRKDGSYLWFHDRCRKILDEGGRRAVIHLCMDISAQKTLENQLSLYRSASRGGIFEVWVDEDLTLLYANDIFYQVHEYTKESLRDRLGNRCSRLICPEDLERFRQEVAEAIAAGKPRLECELRVITGTGKLRWLLINSTFDYRDGCHILKGFVIDNTDKRELIERLYHSHQRYRIALEQTGIEVWEYDILGHCVILPETPGDSEPTQRVENVPQTLLDSGRIHPDSRKDLLELYRRLDAGEKRSTADIKTLRADKSGWWWERITYTTVFDENGKPAYAVAVGADITRQKEAEINYQRELEMRQALSEGILATSRVNLTKNRVELIQRPYENLEIMDHDMTYEDMMEIGAAFIVNPDDLKRYTTTLSREALLKAFEMGKMTVSVEYRKRSNQGRLLWVSGSARLTRDAGSGDIYAYGTIRSIDSRKNLELTLQKRANRDELTGVYNRETALDMIQAAADRAAERGEESGFLVFNIDRFGSLVSSGGYEAANQAVRELSRLLQIQFGSGQIIGRFFSDELAVFLTDTPSSGAVLEKAESVRKAFYELEKPVSISAGIIMNHTKLQDIRDLYDKARVALRAAKSMGRNRCVVYTDVMRENETIEESWAEEGQTTTADKLLIRCAFSMTSSLEFEKSVLATLHYIREYYGVERAGLIEVLPEFGQGAKLYEWRRQGAAVLEDLEGEDRISGICSEYQNVYPLKNGSETAGYLMITTPASHVSETMVLQSIGHFIENEMMRKQFQSRQLYLSYHDALTGLLSRNSYIKYRIRVSQEALISLGIISMDLNGLKKINAQYGHAYGDKAVNLTAELMKKHLPGFLIYRFEGDEFLAIGENMSQEAFTERAVEIKKEINDVYPPGISVGYAWTDTDINIDVLLKHADERMVIAKQEYYLTSDSVSKKFNPQVVKKLKSEIRSGRFKMFLQPKADITTREIIGAEALVRCVDSQNRIIGPNLFVPQLEKAGIIRYIDLFIFEETCRAIRDWIKRGWKPIPVSLNFSRSTLLEDRLGEMVSGIYDRYQVPKELVEIEITESMGELERETMVQIGEKILRAGFKLVLDDFGAKYSNLSVLSALHFDVLKLDKSLVNDLFSNQNTRIVVKKFLETCRELGIQSVAEGVETQEQLEVLKELDCDVAQGYYFNKPIAREDFERVYLSPIVFHRHL